MSLYLPKICIEYKIPHAIHDIPPGLYLWTPPRGSSPLRGNFLFAAAKYPLHGILFLYPPSYLGIRYQESKCIGKRIHIAR